MCNGKALPNLQVILSNRINRGKRELLVQLISCPQKGANGNQFNTSKNLIQNLVLRTGSRPRGEVMMWIALLEKKGETNNEYYSLAYPMRV